MSRGVLGKNNWALVLLILVGVVLGGLIGKLCAGVPALSWLSYGQSFGFVNPMVLDLGILVLTFGFTVDITVAGILGIVIAIIIYRLLYFHAGTTLTWIPSQSSSASSLFVINMHLAPSIKFLNFRNAPISRSLVSI